MIVRRIGVLGIVTVLVMAPVHRNPFQDRSLHRHRTKYGRNKADGTGRLEGAMGKQAMEANRDSDRRQQIYADHQGKRSPTESPPPNENRGRQ